MEIVDVYKEGNHYFKIWIDENGMIQRELIKVERMSMPYDGVELAINVINKYIEQLHRQNRFYESQDNSPAVWINHVRENTLDEVLLDLDDARRVMDSIGTTFRDFDSLDLLHCTYSDKLPSISNPVEEYDKDSIYSRRRNNTSIFKFLKLKSRKS